MKPQAYNPSGTMAAGKLVALFMLLAGVVVTWLPVKISMPGTSAPLVLSSRSSHSLEVEQSRINATRGRFPPGKIPPNGYSRGIHQARLLHLARLSSGWQELGPTYAPKSNAENPTTRARTAAAGRVTALAVDPASCAGTSCSTIYVGAASGGVWKTTDAGSTWAPLTDGQLDIAVGVITLDPINPNIVYVGTGDPDQGQASHHGIGILKSTDGGKTWNTVGSHEFANRGISSIVVDPRTAGSANSTLYVTSTSATSGAASTGGGDSENSPNLPQLGFYYSTDGGLTWARSNPSHAKKARSGGVEAQSMVLDPAHPNTLYAGFNDAGIYKSTDDGKSWSRLTSGLPSSRFSIIRLAISPVDPRILYAAFDMDPGRSGPEALFRTTNSGVTWTKLANTPNACGGQCFGNMHLSIDPQHANVIYAGGTANYGYIFGQNRSCAKFAPLSKRCQATLMKSVNGGATWADVAENGKKGPIHPDNHAILIDPTNSNVIYEGGDGGVFRSADGGRSWQSLNRGLGTFQVQGLSVGPTGEVYAGTQDNGTLKYSGTTTWQHFNDGDGGIPTADPTNANISYSTNAGAILWRNDHNGAPGQNVFIAPFWGDYERQQRGQFYEPYALAPSQPKDIFFGTYRLWRSKIGGGINGPHIDLYGPDATDDPTDKIDWVPISFDLSCPSQPAAGSITCDSADNNGQGVSAVAVSPVNPNVVTAATANGQLWLTTNALAKVKTDQTCDPRANVDDVAKCNYISGVHWTRIDQGLPKRFPSALRFAPGSSTRLYITFSGFDENTPGASGHVFETTDAGRTWRNISGTGANALPDLPFNDMVVNSDNGHLYACADYGVYLSSDDGATWSLINQGLPGVTTYQMQYDARSHMLYVGTFGRGVWRILAP